MIALDTNILIRFLVRDNEAEYQIAEKIFLEREVFIPASVILETEWVLRSVYENSKNEIMKAFEFLLTMTNVECADEAAILRAIDWCKAGLDFADAMHLAASSAALALVTFDRSFVTRAARLSTPIPVLRTL